MADNIISKKVEFIYNDNGADRVLKTAQDLQSVFKSLDNLTRNGKLSTYWTDQASLIKRTEKAFKAYNEQATKDNAKELLKTTNALKALSGGILPETLAGFDKIQNTLMGLKTVELDSMFSVESFQSAFRTMELMEKAGLDVQEIFSKFMVDTSGFDELNQKMKEAEQKASDLSVQLENTQSELKNVKNGTQVKVLEDQIKDLTNDLKLANNDLERIRTNATETFKAFLKANNLVSKYSWGEDNYDDYSFQKYITQIEDGTMDAQQAIAAFKREWSYLFEGTSSDAFGIEQLQDFSKRLDDVNEKLTSVSIKIDEIRADGVKVNSFEGATSGSDIQEVVSSLERMATTENEVSSSSANMYESLGKIFSSLKELGDIETGNLSNIYGIIRNIGELDDVKINKASLENLANCIERLCNVENTSNLSALYNVDLQKFNDLHISKSSLSNLATYLPEIANINVDDLIKLANIDFTNLNNLDGKSLNALKEFSADLKELIKNDTTSTSDKSELDKVATSADEAAKAKQEFVDANEKVQSSVDGSKSKLELETELMEHLATAARTAADAKKEFVEANKQVQDSVDKTTGKTADKTDLSSGGSKVSKNSTNQVLKEQENLLDEVIKKGEKARDVISQVGKREINHVVEKDDNGNITSEYDQGAYSFIERLQDGQLQRVLVTYNNETKEWEENVLSISTAFEKVGNEVIKLDNQINQLELARDKTLAQHPGYDTSADDKLIALAKNRREILESTLSLYAKEPEYEYESVKFEERRRENNEKILALKEKQENIQQVKSDEDAVKAEEKRLSEIQKTDIELKKQQALIDAIEKTYSKAANGNLDRSVTNQDDLNELESLKNQISTKIAGLSGKRRDEINVELADIKILIDQYKQLAKDKLKANNPSKQELGGQDLKVLLSSQVALYNQLIAKAEEYGSETADIVNKLKQQRDLIATMNSDGIYVAKDNLTADDYYNARDEYKIRKAEFSSYETNAKQQEKDKKEIQKQKEIQDAIADTNKRLESITNVPVDNLSESFINLKAKVETLNQELQNGDKTLDQYQASVEKAFSESWKEAIKVLDDFEAAQSKLNNLIATNNSGSNDEQIKNTKNDIEKLTPEFEKVQSVIKELSNDPAFQNYLDKIGVSMEELTSTLERFGSATNGTADSVAKMLDKATTDYNNFSKKYVTLDNKKPQTEAYQKELSVLKSNLEQYDTLIKRIKENGSIVSEKDRERLNELNIAISKSVTELTQMKKAANEVGVEKVFKKIDEFREQYSGMNSTFKKELDAMEASFKHAGDTLDLSDANKQLINFEARLIQTKNNTKSMFDVIKNKVFYGLAGQIANMVSLWDVINVGKQAVSQVIELDTALVDLQKTTTMSSSQLNQFYYDANDVAKQMGVTTQEIIEQASAWSRLGYSSAEAATEMAQLSSQFASISPGMETSDAQEGLVSIMKAWNIGVDDVKSEIMDKINILGNTMAESNQDIVEGMERSAAALASVGTSTEDAFAMFSAIQEVLQSSEVSGRALRSISMRIRGYDEETEELSDDLKNVTGELVDLTKTAEHSQGVSIFKEGSTTEFKSLVDYFGEISEVWDEMTQKQQSDFLQTAFGKTQADLCLYA